MMRRRGAARRGSLLPRRCHPLGEAETISLWEILLIGSSRGLRPSRAHPGAERTDSPPHHPFSDSAEILRISGRGICKEAIFSPGASPHSEKISAFPPHMSLETIGSREGSHPLELSRGAGLMRALVSNDAERGALCSPTPPRGRDARGFTPSRALPGLFGRRFWFPTGQAGGELLPAALLFLRRFARKFRS